MSAQRALLAADLNKASGQVGFGPMGGAGGAGASGGAGGAERERGAGGGAGAGQIKGGAAEQAPRLSEWWQVSQILSREDCAMLHFDLLDPNGERLLPATNLIIWLVDSDGLVLAYENVEVQSVLDGPHQQQLERLAQDMEDSLRIYGRSILRKLYNLCIAPVQEQLSACKSVLVVPAGSMCLIPWAALMDRRGRYLLEAHALRVAPSLSVLARIHATVDLAAATANRLRKPVNTPEGEHKEGRELGAQCSAVVVGDPFPISSKFGTGDPDDAELLHAGYRQRERERERHINTHTHTHIQVVLIIRNSFKTIY